MVNDKEAGIQEEQLVEDREVQNIVAQGREIKRKIMTGKLCVHVSLY